ncbi:MAG: hypothetical protein K0R18_934 [Bacillales bacterium]|jgi:hypothetical protein|nr:hypothetical protein [Bacillales bacterium]
MDYLNFFTQIISEVVHNVFYIHEWTEQNEPNYRLETLE